MNENEGFYNVFEKIINKGHPFIDSYIAERQKESVKYNAKFLNDIDPKYYEDVARSIWNFIAIYNYRTDEDVYSQDFTKKMAIKKRKDDISKTKKFLSIFNEDNFCFSSPNGVKCEDFRQELLDLYTSAEKFLKQLENYKIGYSQKVRASKTELKKIMKSIIKEHKLKGATKKAKIFIDYLDEGKYYTSQSYTEYDY